MSTMWSMVIAWSMLGLFGDLPRLPPEAQRLPGLASIERPDEAARACASYGVHDRWNLSVADGTVAATRVVEPWFRRDPLPFEFDEADVGLQTVAARHVVAVDDGWIVGLDAGEFGGGLWWLDRMGGRGERLSVNNVAALVETGTGVYAFVWGPPSLGSSGMVLAISKAEPGAHWTAARVRNLPGIPVSASRYGQGRVVVVGEQFVAVLDPRSDWTGAAASEDMRGLYPKSVAVGSEGTVYVGMRHFVLVLQPTNVGGFESGWLAPEGCGRLSQSGLDCECSGSGGEDGRARRAE